MIRELRPKPQLSKATIIKQHHHETLVRMTLTNGFKQRNYNYHKWNAVVMNMTIQVIQKFFHQRYLNDIE